MHDLVAIYICPVHGEVDYAEAEEIDFETDETYRFSVCTHNMCLRETKPKIQNGLQCYRTMTQAEVDFRDGHYEEPF